MILLGASQSDVWVSIGEDSFILAVSYFPWCNQRKPCTRCKQDRNLDMLNEGSKTAVNTSVIVVDIERTKKTK